MPTTHDYYEDSRNDDIKIYINGDFFHRKEAKVPVMDSGFLLGDGVWEGIRLHKGRFLHLSAHLNRLFEGADQRLQKGGLSGRLGVKIFLYGDVFPPKLHLQAESRYP